MDPIARDTELPVLGLPRTRGDGPRWDQASEIRRVASPHPRGWTRGRRPDRGRGLGFPAPAGMDPRCGGLPDGTRGLPRTRGDGPRRRIVVSGTNQASPHPRGWTLKNAAGGRVRPGFPAPAGMDPSSNIRSRPSTRLPRTRGDGPVSHRATRPGLAASPHPRGWTRFPSDASGPVLGFPAPAGMDPSSAAARPGTAWLPRTRGDGPNLENANYANIRASPHPRGWTVRSGFWKAIIPGFPAPAGMDPPTPAARCRPWGLPRTRGDGPVWTIALHSFPGASPHPRGWTR